jgi:hypothetical protein
MTIRIKKISLLMDLLILSFLELLFNICSKNYMKIIWQVLYSLTISFHNKFKNKAKLLKHLILINFGKA